METLNLSRRDIDALARLAYAEAASIATKTGDERLAYGTVVDAVLNRAAAKQDYLGGGSISGVINRRTQFSPVNELGTWEKLPKPPQQVYDTVTSYLADRAAGQPNYMGKATHYLNPDLADDDAKRTWARDWRSWPSVGVGKTRHYFGSPDPITVPDLSVSFEPDPIPTPRPTGSPYQDYARTRSLAPAAAVDRSFPTRQRDYARLGASLSAAGVAGLDGRLTAAPVPSAPVQPPTTAPVVTKASRLMTPDQRIDQAFKTTSVPGGTRQPGAGMAAKYLANRANGKNLEEWVQTILSGVPANKVELLSGSARRVAAALMAAQAANASAD